MNRAPFVCFGCSNTLDMSTHGQDPPTRKPGDFAICLHCGALLVFGDDARSLRPPWSEERRRFETDPVFRIMRDLLERARKAVPGLRGINRGAN
jgi:hypothetical protein